MSSDLAKVGDKFTVSFKGSKIELANWNTIAKTAKNVKSALDLMDKYAKPLIAYASSSGCISPLISLVGTLTQMGIPGDAQSSLAGLYKVTINSDNHIEFDLDKELK